LILCCGFRENDSSLEEWNDLRQGQRAKQRGRGGGYHFIEEGETDEECVS
jgi:hypothetical protein